MNENMSDDDLEELLSAFDPVELNPSKVPDNLRHLTPLAQKWGTIGAISSVALRKSDDETLKDLIDSVESHNDHLNDWLAGPEADSPKSMSAEYIAFTELRLAADSARLILQRRQGRDNIS